MITFVLAVCGNVDYIYTFPQSPPSRAAWIEMSGAVIIMRGLDSRRLHGRRGLKSVIPCVLDGNLSSPPSRAAWIEIHHVWYVYVYSDVAAFTGGVD